MFVFGFLLLAGAANPARAASSLQATAQLRSVEVVAGTCENDGFPLASFLDSLRVELAGRGFACCMVVNQDDPSLGSGVWRVSLAFPSCAPEALAVRIGVVEAQQTGSAASEVSLTDVAPSARARALALATAELIRTLEQGQSALPPAPVVEEKAPPTPPPPEAPQRLSLHLEGRMRASPPSDTTSWGGRLRLLIPRRVLYAELDAGADYASARAPMGKVSLRAVSLGMGAGLRLANRTTVLGLGPRGEVGRVWIRGETQATDVREGSGTGTFATLGLRASLQFPAERPLRAGMGLEAGGVLMGASGVADGHTVIGITGYYLIGTVAMGFSP